MASYSEDFRRGDVPFSYKKVVDVSFDRKWNMCIRVTALTPRQSLPNGGLLMVWVASPDFEASRQNKIWMAVSTDAGENWSQPVVLQHSPQNSYIINPVCYTHDDGSTFVFFYDNSASPQATLFRKLPNDKDPMTASNWTVAQQIVITDGGKYGACFSPPIQLVHQEKVNPTYQGAVVLPGYFQEDGKNLRDGKNLKEPIVGTVLISQDGCSTWTTGGTIRVPKIGDVVGHADEPTIAENYNGKLICFLRTMHGALWRTDSEDAGHSWTDPVESQFKSPYAPAALLYLQSSNLILVWNNVDPAQDPVTSPPWYQPRCCLSIVASRDQGDTWGHIQLIDTNAGDKEAGLTNHGIYQVSYTRILLSVFDGMGVWRHRNTNGISHLDAGDIGPIRQATFSEAIAMPGAGLVDTAGKWTLSDTQTGGVRWDNGGLLLFSGARYKEVTTIVPSLRLNGNHVIKFMITEEAPHPSNIAGFFIGGDPWSTQPSLAFYRGGLAGEDPERAHPRDIEMGRPPITRFPCLVIRHSDWVPPDRPREQIFSVDNYYKNTLVTVEILDGNIHYRDSNGADSSWQGLPSGLSIPTRWGFFTRSHGVQGRLRIHSVSVD